MKPLYKLLISILTIGLLFAFPPLLLFTPVMVAGWFVSKFGGCKPTLSDDDDDLTHMMLFHHYQNKNKNN